MCSFSRSRRASLALVVVLPEPCRPVISTTAGGEPRLSPLSSAPRIATSSSWTILTTIWPGVTLLITSWPTARLRTRLTRSLTTGNATSASSSAMRISRIASITSSSLSAPRRLRRSSTPLRRLVRLSNINAIPRAPHHRLSGGAGRAPSLKPSGSRPRPGRKSGASAAPARESQAPGGSAPGASAYSTVIVIFSDSTGGSCGIWFWSARSSCSVWVPGGSSRVTSV